MEPALVQEGNPDSHPGSRMFNVGKTGGVDFGANGFVGMYRIMLERQLFSIG